MSERIEVTSETAFKYISSQIQLSGKFLADCISNLELARGRVFAYTNEMVSKDSLNTFESGDIDSYKKEFLIFETNLIPIRNDSRRVLIELIKNYLDSSSTNCCIFEEPV